MDAAGNQRQWTSSQNGIKPTWATNYPDNIDNSILPRVVYLPLAPRFQFQSLRKESIIWQVYEDFNKHHYVRGETSTDSRTASVSFEDHNSRRHETNQKWKYRNQSL